MFQGVQVCFGDASGMFRDYSAVVWDNRGGAIYEASIRRANHKAASKEGASVRAMGFTLFRTNNARQNDRRGGPRNRKKGTTPPAGDENHAAASAVASSSDASALAIGLVPHYTITQQIQE